MAQKAEYNSILTERAFTPDDDFCRARKAHVLCDASGKILGSVSNTGVYDLFGDEIAGVTGEAQTRVGNEDVRASEAHTYCLEGDALYDTSGETKKYIGSIIKKERNPFKIIVLSALAVLLTVTIVLLALIQMPSVNVPPKDPDGGTDSNIVPIIEIQDKNGAWEAQGEVGVFDGRLCPGTEGTYGFILGNPHDEAMQYAFYIEPKYNGGVKVEFPIQFRLRMNNLPVQSTEWKSVDELRFEELHILPQSSQTFTLEWRWPLDGNNENDTLIGKDGGTISLVLHVSAQAR